MIGRNRRIDRPAVWLPVFLLAAAAVVGGCAVKPTTQEVDHRPAVMMVLSPRMPYALREWRRMRQAASDAGFEVLAMRDPRVPDAEWQAAVRALGLAELSEIPVLQEDLAVRLGVLHHAPSSIVTRCGIRHPWPILGVMPDSQWTYLLRQRAMVLGAGPCR